MGVFDDPNDPIHEPEPSDVCDIFKSVDSADPRGRKPTVADEWHREIELRNETGAARGEGQRRRWGRRRA